MPDNTPKNTQQAPPEPVIYRSLCYQHGVITIAGETLTIRDGQCQVHTQAAIDALCNNRHFARVQ